MRYRRAAGPLGGGAPFPHDTSFIGKMSYKMIKKGYKSVMLAQNNRVRVGGRKPAGAKGARAKQPGTRPGCLFIIVSS